MPRAGICSCGCTDGGPTVSAGRPIRGRLRRGPGRTATGSSRRAPNRKTAWRTTPAVPVLQPEASYECPDLPNAPSDAGDVEIPVKQIRDPFVFEDEGKSYLFYSICGEQGIAAAEVDLRALSTSRD